MSQDADHRIFGDYQRAAFPVVPRAADVLAVCDSVVPLHTGLRCRHFHPLVAISARGHLLWCLRWLLCLKMLIYWFVNSVFFGKKKSTRWLKSFLFITSFEGVALFPLVMLQSYFDLSIQNAVFYVAFVIVLVKLLLLYKSYVVFFGHKTFFLQIILYFCALELCPCYHCGVFW